MAEAGLKFVSSSPHGLVQRVGCWASPRASSTDITFLPQLMSGVEAGVAIQVASLDGEKARDLDLARKELNCSTWVQAPASNALATMGPIPCF